MKRSDALVNSELKIRRRRDSTTADLVEGVWGEVAVAMGRKIEIGDKKKTTGDE